MSAGEEKKVPHFHLNVRHGTDLVEDRVGAEYKSLMNARSEAIAAARQIMSVGHGTRANNSRFEIADHGGEIWLIVSFLEADLDLAH